MSDIMMIFTSMSGNTEEMAEAIAKGIRETGNELEVNDMIGVSSATVLENYDGILLGAYTWGDGELPDEFLDFYEEMDDIDLTGKKAAVFGSCDSSYPHHGAAVDILIEKLREKGAEIILKGLKIESTPSEDDIEICKEFGREFVKNLYME